MVAHAARSGAYVGGETPCELCSQTRDEGISGVRLPWISLGTLPFVKQPGQCLWAESNQVCIVTSHIKWVLLWKACHACKYWAPCP